ncbi:MAG TPA: hypothetical protein VFS39_13615 [Nitrospira sp.]|nr:hypothetical protein [Nitrospira sp.]
MRVSCAAMLCLVLGGCVSTGTSTLADDRTIAKIQVGKTTKNEVSNILGDPDGRHLVEIANTTRQWWTYSYAKAEINPIDYLLLYGFFYNGIGTYDTRYDVDVFFDDRDVVTSLSRMKTEYDLGRPFTRAQVSSITERTIGFPEPGKRPIHFEGRLDYRD